MCILKVWGPRWHYGLSLWSGGTFYSFQRELWSQHLPSMTIIADRIKWNRSEHTRHGWRMDVHPPSDQMWIINGFPLSAEPDIRAHTGYPVLQESCSVLQKLYSCSARSKARTLISLMLDLSKGSVKEDASCQLPLGCCLQTNWGWELCLAAWEDFFVVKTEGLFCCQINSLTRYRENFSDIN